MLAEQRTRATYRQTHTDTHRDTHTRPRPPDTQTHTDTHRHTQTHRNWALDTRHIQIGHFTIAVIDPLD